MPGIHTFTHCVKVAFFRGTSLRPVPPGASKSKDTRYLDIREGEKLDEVQMATWVKQAAALPGWVPQSCPRAVFPATCCSTIEALASVAGAQRWPHRVRSQLRASIA
jgi:hypothetical protein